MRHSAGQIATKLRKAEALQAEGRTQKEIAQSLGISVMTFHRWRKEQRPRPRSATSTELDHPIIPLAEPTIVERRARISELQLENGRLRKLVTDLLLEKMLLDEQGPSSLPRRRLKRAHR